MGKLKQLWETTDGDQFSEKSEALEYQKGLDRADRINEEMKELAERLEMSLLNDYDIYFDTTDMAIKIVEFFNDRYRFIVDEIDPNLSGGL